MFCPKCGGKNLDHAAFCSSCGMNFQEFASGRISSQGYHGSNSVYDRMNMRNCEVAELNKMINYFSQKSAQYQEYDDVCDMMERAKGKRVGLLVWGIIICSFSLFLLIIIIGSSGSSKSNGTSSAVVGFFSIAIPGVVLIVLFIITSTARSRHYNDAIMRYDQLTTELYNYYLAYGPCPVGCEYTNPSNLMIILQTIQSGRADTTKDAINVLAEENYRRNMQAIAQQAARSAAAAARGANTAAVFSAANFFLN